MVRDIRYIFKKVLIGLLIAIGIMFIKSKGVFAATSYSGTTTVYVETDNCTLDNSNNITCVKGTPYKFVGSNNSSTQTDIPFLVNNSNNDVLIKNAIYDIQFDNPIGIDYSYSPRSVYLSFGGGSTNNNGVTTIGTGSSNMQMYYSQFYFTPVESSDNNKVIPITYGFKPYYCSYHNVSTGNTETCNVALDIGNSDNYYKVALLLDDGILFDRFTLYFGTYDDYVGTSKTLNNVLVPNSSTITGSSSNWSISYNNYRQSNYTSIGLQYIKQGVSMSTPLLKPLSRSSSISGTSSNYSNNTYKWTFTSLSNELKTKYQAQIGIIVEDLEQEENGGEEDVPEWLENTFGDFNGTYANNFTSLFSSLFAYPISKMNQQLTFDLANYNTWTQQKVIDSKVCWGTDSILGDVMPNYKVHFFRDYTFNLPCPHNDIYRHLGYGNYGFYPPNFQDSVEPGYTYSFATLWLTIQHGILVYLLFVNCLNIYKYILDSNKSDVEVLEL